VVVTPIDDRHQTFHRQTPKIGVPDAGEITCIDSSQRLRFAHAELFLVEHFDDLRRKQSEHPCWRAAFIVEVAAFVAVETFRPPR
jgi:hypothetical protein